MDSIGKFLDPSFVPGEPASKEFTRGIFDELIGHTFRRVCSKLRGEPEEEKRSLALEAVEILFLDRSRIIRTTGIRDAVTTRKIVYSYLNKTVDYLTANYLRRRKQREPEVPYDGGEPLNIQESYLLSRASVFEAASFEGEKLGFSLAFVHHVLNYCLSEDDRLIIKERFLTHPPSEYDDIAAKIDSTVVAVRQRYCRALRRWRQAIVDEARMWLRNKEWKKLKNGDPLVLQQLIDDLED